MDERVLVIDDDTRLSEMVVGYFDKHGLRAEARADGQSGLDALASEPWSAVILDVMLPDFDGFEVCRRIRALDSAASRVPIVMLTARGEDTDRIVGLELGADDYLPKPFNPRELLARVRAVVRRHSWSSAPVEETDLLQFGRLDIDRGARVARVDGRIAKLTAHQFELLRVLAEAAGRVLSRDQIMEAVRGMELEAFDRSIDVHISRIRAAIEDDPKNPQWVKTVRGVGYVLAPGGHE